ncbi:MAG: hypothetical protein Sv326_0787 [Candidatus Fermentimicrarchaeum limneticum]|jgi:uncharacterized protein (UPF0333 family)|uniref:Class III signal peptide-containing protein n=1 Tax=Fermentimicrarchaeum limneticum TaxID=2795018 RepID=A0A7D6BNW5_FERL1|nr:MAG: hypothetical protein Sv326_0787 [Candidatus Fermentimicrarchaeum limneticum]
MKVLSPQFTKAQTTIEYLLIISVVVLLMIGLFLTIRELRASTQGNVTIGNESKSPIEAINGTLQELGNFNNTNNSD